MNISFEIDEICNAILVDSAQQDFRGHDPFDALNSKYVRRLYLDRWNFARILWLQFHKRSPVNFRSVSGVEKARNPKGIALFILGLVERYKINRSKADLDLALGLANWLIGEAVDRGEWKHYAWGYHFDWAARAFFVPRGKPNAITTCYVARALRALGELAGKNNLVQIADDAGYFIDGLYVKCGDLEYYAYIPGESAYVHNASLWAAAVAMQTAENVGDSLLKGRALRVALQSVQAQSADGSWAYGNRGHHSFIDGFHTGYNLEALHEIQSINFDDRIHESIDRGMRFYRENFFTDKGEVKYFHDTLWPIDTHSVAQAVITLLKIGDTLNDLRAVEKIISRAIETLYLKRERRFAYQIGRFAKNKINYLRWTQAWAFYALSFYLRQRKCTETELQ